MFYAFDLVVAGGGRSSRWYGLSATTNKTKEREREVKTLCYMEVPKVHGSSKA